MTALSEAEIQLELASRPGWTGGGKGIRKTFEFNSFPEAIAFVTRVAQAAEEQNHHPDIDIRYRRVILHLVTHDAGGVTKKDLQLAAAADGLEESGA